MAEEDYTRVSFVVAPTNSSDDHNLDHHPLADATVPNCPQCTRTAIPTPPAKTHPMIPLSLPVIACGMMCNRRLVG